MKNSNFGSKTTLDTGTQIPAKNRKRVFTYLGYPVSWHLLPFSPGPSGSFYHMFRYMVPASLLTRDLNKMIVSRRRKGLALNGLADFNDENEKRAAHGFRGGDPHAHGKMKIKQQQQQQQQQQRHPVSTTIRRDMEKMSTFTFNISKKKFCEAISFMKERDSAFEDLSVSIARLGSANSSFHPCDDYDDLIIDLLSLLTDDSNHLIELYVRCFEYGDRYHPSLDDDSSSLISPDGAPVPFSTPGDLYDCLLSEAVTRGHVSPSAAPGLLFEADPGSDGESNDEDDDDEDEDEDEDEEDEESEDSPVSSHPKASRKQQCRDSSRRYSLLRHPFVNSSLNGSDDDGDE